MIHFHRLHIPTLDAFYFSPFFPLNSRNKCHGRFISVHVRSEAKQSRFEVGRVTTNWPRWSRKERNRIIYHNSERKNKKERQCLNDTQFCVHFVASLGILAFYELENGLTAYLVGMGVRYFSNFCHVSCILIVGGCCYCLFDISSTLQRSKVSYYMTSTYLWSKS